MAVNRRRYVDIIISQRLRQTRHTGFVHFLQQHNIGVGQVGVVTNFGYGRCHFLPKPNIPAHHPNL